MTRQIVKTALAVMTTLLALLILWQFRIVGAYVLISLTLAAALRPLINRLVWAGTLARAGWVSLLLLALGCFGYLFFQTGEAAINDLQQLARTVSVRDAWVQPDWLQGDAFQETLIDRLPPPSKLLEALTGDQGQLILPALFGFTQGFGEIVSALSVILFLSIYWSINQIHFERLWLSLLPSDQRKQAREIWRAIELHLGAYIRSELIQSILAALLLGAGYWLLGSPYPALLGLMGALLWLVPVMGAPMAILPPLLIGLLSSVELGLLTAIYTLGVLIALQFWVEPRLFKGKSGNPILTLVILLALADTFGLPGMLSAPPLSAICQILWDLLGSSRMTGAAAAQISDIKARLALLRENILEMDEPPIALISSSMERLSQLIEKSEPVLKVPVNNDPPA